MSTLARGGLVQSSRSSRFGSLRLLPLLGALIAGALLPAKAAAQDYPNRPISMIVPFAVAGLTDVPARILAAMLQDRIGQRIIVENKPGGSGTLGGSYAVRSAPDGYTLFANSIADTQNLYFLPVPYNAIDDFAMIGMIVEGPPLVLIIDAALPYKTLDDLLADARANPKKISFGTSGPGTATAMALSQLNALAKTDIAGVPYRGSGEAARNVSGSAIQGAFVFYAQAKLPRRRRQSARARHRKPAAHRDLARSAHHEGIGLCLFRL